MNAVADPWISALEAFEPTYNDLRRLMEDGPNISCSITKKHFQHCVRIHEDWANTPSDQQYQYYTASDDKVGQRIEWASEQLSSWKFVRRTSYDQWMFLRKCDAEKFITLFTLKWACQ